MMFDSLIQYLRQDLASNARLRFLLLLALAIAWVWGIAALRSETLKRERTLTLENAELVRAQGEDVTVDWTQRLDQAIGARNKAGDALWREPTYGLAQARFQDWVRSVVSKSPSIRKQSQVLTRESAVATDIGLIPSDAVKPGETLNDRFWVVRARVELDFSPQILNQFLSEVQASPKRVVVESLNVRRESPPLIQAVLVAHFLNPAFATQRDSVVQVVPGAASPVGLPPNLPQNLPR
jgi:hypothetical protein